MAVVKDTESVEAKIQWYNNQVAQVKDKFEKWLKEMGYSVKTETTKITNNEQKSGPYETYQYDLLINGNLPIRLIPYGIWNLEAEGRIDISGPAGYETLEYFLKKSNHDINKISYPPNETLYYSMINDVTEDNWYWLATSPYDKIRKLSKEIIPSLLESIQ